MILAVVTLSAEGAHLAYILGKRFPQAQLYVHDKVRGTWSAERFSSIVELTGDLFHKCSGLVFIAPCGVVVRALAPYLEHKTTDPAVVVVDVGGRWAVSLLSGHEGGANELALEVANWLGAEPVISTTTEALKNLIVGVGCRRGVRAEAILAAVRQTLADAQLDVSHVRMVSSADIKADEAGLREAARVMGVPLRFIASDDIRACVCDFQHSDFVEDKVNLPAVAEPCALLAGRRTQLLVPRTIHDGVTVAVAEESFLWSE